MDSRLLASLAAKLARDVQESAQTESEAAKKVLSFIEFVEIVRPGYIWNWHTERLASVCQRVADGELRRVMVFMPPRHGKSELVSRLFAAYYLYRHADRWVGVCAYSANLAYPLSKAARGFFKRAGGLLDPEMRAIKEWMTTAGGGLWAAGVSGSVTGKGWNLGIIDDPIKDAQAAYSETIRAGQKDWFESTFSTREMPPDALIVVSTLWHEDDLPSSMIAREFEECEDTEFGTPENWHIVYYPAVMPPPEERRKFPASCTLEPDPRETGQALWPLRYPIAKLERMRRKIHEWFDALYQQNPLPPGGSILQKSWFTPITPDMVPVITTMAMAVDLAVTAKQTSDYWVALPGGIGVDENYYIFKPWRDKVEAPDAESPICARATEARVRIIGIESVAFQASFIHYLRKRRELAGIPVVPIKGEDKQARARGWAPFAQQGRIFLVDDGSGWVQEFLNEMAKFPRGKNDDQVDCMGMLFELFRQFGVMQYSPQVAKRPDQVR